MGYTLGCLKLENFITPVYYSCNKGERLYSALNTIITTDIKLLNLI